MEHAVGAPLRLPDRLARAAGHQPRLVRGVERRHPQLGAVPRHVRVVPAGPRERRAVRAEAREGVEVAARGEHARLAVAVGGQRHQLVRGLAVLAVGLAHAHDQPPVGAHAAVGVADRAGPRRLGRDRPRRLRRGRGGRGAGRRSSRRRRCRRGGTRRRRRTRARACARSRPGGVTSCAVVHERRAPAVLGPALEPPGRPVRRRARAPSAGRPRRPPWLRTGATATSRRGRSAWPADHRPVIRTAAHSAYGRVHANGPDRHRHRPAPPLRRGRRRGRRARRRDASPSSAGRFSAIMGPSGSGKSTLMHILAGLDRPTSGTVELDGVEITALDDGDLTKLRRDKLGFIFQFFNLIPVLTAEENIVLPLSIAGQQARRGVARAADRHGRPRRPPHAPPVRALRRPAAARGGGAGAGVEARRGVRRRAHRQPRLEGERGGAAAAARTRSTSSARRW